MVPMATTRPDTTRSACGCVLARDVRVPHGADAGTAAEHAGGTLRPALVVDVTALRSR